MNLEGLSFANIPKFSTPLRFFISAPFFGLVACLILLMPDIWISRWQPELLALTHIFTLGFFVMIMFGALTQVLPVLTGRGISRVDKLAPRIHLCLVLGVIIFPFNFIFQDPFILWLSLIPLLFACSMMLIALAYLFMQKAIDNPSIKAIRFALLGLVLSLITGLIQLLTFQYSSISPILMGKSMTNLHLMWGLVGWVNALIMAVSFQVIPMFHVTPDFPVWLRRYWPMGLFLSLIGVTLGVVFQWTRLQYLGSFLIALGLLTYALSTLHILAHRKRKISDVTVTFWRLAMISLIASIVIVSVAQWSGQTLKSQLQMLAILVFIFGYLMSVVLGMLVKIVPFLAYLNLQQSASNCFQAMIELPSIYDIQGPQLSRRLFQSYCLVIPCLILIPWFQLTSVCLAFILALVFSQLIYLEFNTWFSYKHHAEKIQTLIKEQSEEGC